MNTPKILLTIAVAIVFFSCSKTNNDSQQTIVPVAAAPITKPIDSAASYTITITGTWKNPEHTIPNNVHFTAFMGLVHGKDGGIFKLGSLASVGVENIAEVGRSAVLETEMASQMEQGFALSKFALTMPGVTGDVAQNIMVNTKNSLISFESMIAPSPDWFAGIDSYNLIQNGKWIDDVTVPVFGYDAGTEEGDVFAYNSPASNPHQPISLMTPANASVIANGNSSIAPFATVRFVKQ